VSRSAARAALGQGRDPYSFQLDYVVLFQRGIGELERRLPKVRGLLSRRRPRRSNGRNGRRADPHAANFCARPPPGAAIRDQGLAPINSLAGHNPSPRFLPKLQSIPPPGVTTPETCRPRCCSSAAPRDELEAEPVIDHREPTGGKRNALAIDPGDVLALERRLTRQSGLARQLRAGGFEFPTAQSVQESRAKTIRCPCQRARPSLARCSTRWAMASRTSAPKPAPLVAGSRARS
jgi:hypothetical protein